MNVIRFAHYRNYDNTGINSRGGLTVAYVLNDENRVVQSATAYCSKKDNYSRKRGRDLAAGRLQYKHLSEQHDTTREAFLALRDAESKTQGYMRRGNVGSLMLSPSILGG